MDPLTLAASYATAKTAIAACKSALETADDIGAVAGHLDAIFNSNKEVQKNKKAVDRSHNEKVVENRLGDGDGSPDDPTSLAGAARAYVAHAEHEEAIKSLAKALNARFGPDTWDNIIKQQKQAIADAEKREKEAKLAAEERAERRQKYLIEFGKGLAVLAIAGGIGSFLYWAATSGPAVK